MNTNLQYYRNRGNAQPSKQYLKTPKTNKQLGNTAKSIR